MSEDEIDYNGERYTREDVLNNPHLNVTEDDVKMVEEVGRAWLGASDTAFIVWRWEHTPAPITKVCRFNGGDEDWVIITRKEPEWLPLWLERTSVDEKPDVYLFNNLVVYVGTHS